MKPDSLRITPRIPKRNGNLWLVSISKKRWVLRWISAILMVGHHPVLFPISPPKSKTKPHPSMNLVFPNTDHRGPRFIRQIAMAVSLLLSQGGVEMPSYTSEKRIQWVWQALLISLLPSSFPSLSMSPPFSWYGVSSIFLLLLIPFLSSSSFFCVG